MGELGGELTELARPRPEGGTAYGYLGTHEADRGWIDQRRCDVNELS